MKNTDTIEIRKGQRDRMLRAYDYLRSHNFVETTDDVALRIGPPSDPLSPEVGPICPFV